MDLCVTCSTMQTFVDLLTTTKTSIYGYLGEQFLPLLNGMMLFFATWTIFRSMAYGRSFEWVELLEQAFTALLVASALSSGFFWWPVFDLIVETGTFMAQKVGELGGLPAPKNAGLVGFVETVEQIVYRPVMTFVEYGSSEISITRLGSSMLLIIAVAFYVLLVWEMLKSVVRSYFAIQAIALLGAPLVFFYTFEDTRSFTMNGLKIVIVNALRLFMGMAVASVVLIVFQKLGTANDMIKTVNHDEFSQFSRLVLSALVMWLGYGTFMSVVGEVFQVFGQQQNLSVGGLLRGIVQRFRG